MSPMTEDRAQSYSRLMEFLRDVGSVKLQPVEQDRVRAAADTLVLPSQSSALSDRLSAVGVSNRLIVIPGEGHGFGLRAGGRDLLGTIARFLSDSMPARR